jgi:choline dehydrogenase-like flavoprotein
MLLDARALDPRADVDADVCIVGAGAAGITLALELIDRHLRVVVLEGGGLQADEWSQRLYQGGTTGRPYYALDACRVRYLGGSTNTWGGWCRPLDAIDFSERDWLPHSGWPFTRDTLIPYYERAHAVCKLGPCDYDAARWNAHGASLVPAHARDVADTLFHVGPTRFGQEYRHALERASNVRLLLHACALEIEMDPSHRTAVGLLAGTSAGKRFTVRAGAFVLAAGGIENPRLLLASRKGRSPGIGNERDLVGRFFAEHLHVPVAKLVQRDGMHGFYAVHRAGAATIRGAVSVTDCARQREQLLGWALTFHNADDPHDVLSPTRLPPSYESLSVLIRALRRRERPGRLLHHLGTVAAGADSAAALAYKKLRKPRARQLIVGCRAEQSPNPDSRVTLDDSVDAFGMPRVRLHWQLTARDRESFDRAQSLWRRELASVRAELTPLGLADEPWTTRMAPGAHHMGTTRMHPDPSRGVVNEDCRVHGTSNVFVGGSSVFPTAGWAPPTLTIVALALRLADHLKATPGARERASVRLPSQVSTA